MELLPLIENMQSVSLCTRMCKLVYECEWVRVRVCEFVYAYVS